MRKLGSETRLHPRALGDNTSRNWVALQVQQAQAWDSVLRASTDDRRQLARLIIGGSTHCLAKSSIRGTDTVSDLLSYARNPEGYPTAPP
jgi:hypothetical protein